MSETVAKHGAFGVGLGLVTLVLPGALAVVVAVLRDVLPAQWLQYQPPLTEGTARGGVLVIGVSLLIFAKGYFSFWRVGWFGYVVWAVANLITFVSAFNPEAGVFDIQVFAILVVLGLPYLWVRRRDFRVGPRPNVGGA